LAALECDSKLNRQDQKMDETKPAPSFDSSLDGETMQGYDIARAALLVTNGLDEIQLLSGVSRALGATGEYADLYLKTSMQESWSLEHGAVNRGSFNIDHGFGLRTVQGDQSVLATSQIIDLPSVRRSANLVAETTGAVGSSNIILSATQPNQIYYRPDDPIADGDVATKIALLEAIDVMARRHDARVVDVRANLMTSRDLVFIARHDGYCGGDARPTVRLDVKVQVLHNGRRESASRTLGGRNGLARFTPDLVRQMTEQVVDAALCKLDARPAPAGCMTVVIGPGWNGVLLHEAVGHGLEGDLNQRGASAFSGRIGQRVAASGVTIVDDGTVIGSRGSLNIDDEGTPGQCTMLIEDGVLKGYMHDATSARLMGAARTGNGRRESYKTLPMPRMTNTYMRAGDTCPEEIIASVKNGIYVANLEGGQVDMTSGRFTFSASEAYLIEGGRLTAPIKDATVLGDGPEALQRVKLIGNDLQIDTGAGNCGKAGQTVPVGVGQPTLRVDGMTVGGTA
jgi:TldD protein